MTAYALTWLVARLGLSRFVAGMLFAGAIAGAFAGWSGLMVHAGYRWADQSAQVRELKAESASLSVMLATMQHQRDAANAIVERDAETAAQSKEHILALEGQLRDIPPDTSPAFSAAAARRLRNVR